MKEQILLGKDSEAISTYQKIIKNEFLWENAFSGNNRNSRSFNSEYKKSILNWGFILFRRKIQEGEFEDQESYSGIIVVLLREAKREFYKEFLPKIFQVIESYNDYIPGVILFNYTGWSALERREELLDIVFYHLDRIGNPCNQLIKNKHLKQMTHEEIVESNIGFTTIASSRTKLSQCMDILREKVFKEIGKNEK
ncbi:hypothetical protein LJB92_00390 [Bacteroidales bacterium OttesenSCG-928-M06]|nr:hypothetical protein [Bacteroidales bacterium OttesenSCG-928-M06]